MVVVRGLMGSVSLVMSDGASHTLTAQITRQWARCIDASAVVAEGFPRIHVDAAGYTLQGQVTLQLIAASSGLLMWHAAGISLNDGRVLGLVGASGMGKSTAVAHLTRRTWGYVTDETLGVDPDGRVWAYPKPLALIRPGASDKVKPPGVSGDFEPWEGWSHARRYAQAVPA